MFESEATEEGRERVKENFSGDREDSATPSGGSGRPEEKGIADSAILPTCATRFYLKQSLHENFFSSRVVVLVDLHLVGWKEADLPAIRTRSPAILELRK